MRDTTAKMTAKYASYTISDAEAYAKTGTPTLRAIATVADKIEQNERSLSRAASQLADLAAKITSNVTAGPDDRVFGLNPSGELQGSDAGRVNATIAERAALISQLQMLVHLHREVSPAVFPNGTTVLVTPRALPGKTAKAPFTGVISGKEVRDVSDRPAIYWVTDAMGREYEVSPKIIRRIEPVTVKGYNDGEPAPDQTM